ncbi:hypothetical protein TNCV_5078971 [Trichonephila clavipes]|nr:hypothetical protein TNCV_5078971 [Trichonephila clavipes]
MQEESDPVDDETDEDENHNKSESSKDPSNADAFSALETAMEWYEQQSECCAAQLLLPKRIRVLVAKKKGSHLEDRGIGSKKQGMFDVVEDNVVYVQQQQIMIDKSCKQLVGSKHPKLRRLKKKSFFSQQDEGSRAKQSKISIMWVVCTHVGQWCVFR